MERSYLDYAMSVIVSRALPDIRDGLKPVHRRILYAMKEGGYDASHSFRKSARIVGEVMGKYHPHGDQAIYDALVRMAQTFSMRLPLIDGQGNFGSMDGDPPAAFRYTEARLARTAETLLDDIDQETVNFQPNYDDTDLEPTVLPARYPNLLVNGAGGIAVGMATNIPPHNLGEVLDACVASIDNPSISIDELMEIVPGPDFPTGGLIMGQAGIISAYHTGRGSVIMRSRTNIESLGNDREAIIVTELPYQVNKARLVERIAEVVREKIVEGISDLRDESDRDGVRIVIELKRDAMTDVVLAQLYRSTPLQTSFGVNMLALTGDQPLLVNIKTIITSFIEFREEVITRRTVFQLRRARDRAHVLVGLLVAITNLNPVIQLIRKAKDPATAREELTSQNWAAGEISKFIGLLDDPGHEVVGGEYQLSDVQARAILELRLQRLTGMEREKLGEEMENLAKQIGSYLDILQSKPKLFDIMRAEFLEVRQKFADQRRTEIVDSELEHDIEDLIQREDMVITVTHGGYIKRVPLSTYRAQRRGGKGRAGMSTREEDVVSNVFVASTHAPILFFSTRGMVYQLKAWRLPQSTPQARGKAMVNLLPLQDDEAISTVMALPNDEEVWDELTIIFATSRGTVRRNKLTDFTNIKANGKIAMKLPEGDHLVNVCACTDDDDVLLAARDGKCIRFCVTDVRVFSGRGSTGVRGMNLLKNDVVISMSILRHEEIDIDVRDNYLRSAAALRRSSDDEAVEDAEKNIAVNNATRLSSEELETLSGREEFILTIAENGYGKRSSAYEYRITKRGGRGIVNIETSARNGTVVAAFPVEADDQIVLVTDGGQLIRVPVNDIRIAGRRTQGVTLFDVESGERVTSVSRLRDVGEDNGQCEEIVEVECDNVVDNETTSVAD